MKKKIWSLILAGMVCLSLTISTFAVSNDPPDIDEMRAFLISREYPADFLEKLIDPQIESLYHSVAANNTYFYGFVTESGTIEPGYTTYADSLQNDIELTVMVGIPPVVSGGSQSISELYVYVYYDWTKLPSIRFSDAISLNWDSSLFAYASMHATDYAQSGISGKWIKNATWNSPTTLGQGGLGYNPCIRYDELLGDASVPASGLKGNAEIKLVPKIEMTDVKTVSTPSQAYTNFNAEYVHSTLAVTPSFSFSGTSGGVAINITTTMKSLAATYLFKYWK